MATISIGPEGELTLPADVRSRHGFKPDQLIRVIETRGGVLLVPLDGRDITDELARELDAWQGLAAETWDSFPFEEPE